MKNFLKRVKNERGLTLVELLAVIVILAIIGAIAFVAIGKVTENARKDAAVADSLQAINAAKLYEITSNNDYSEGKFKVDVKELQATEEDGDAYLETLYDPWTKDPHQTGNVTKESDGSYKMNGFKTKKCEIDATEQDLIKDGRKVCEKNKTPSTE